MTSTFAFKAGARPVFAQTKFKQESDTDRTAYHITVDPRVARGSVYSHHKPPTDTVQPIRYRPRPIPTHEKEEYQMADNEEEDLLDKIAEPTLYEIDDRPIEDDLATANETYIERPPTPQFIEDEPGIDVATQVGENDLFDFDREVRPMIKVIVQHTLLRALAEVHEEVEVENISKHRDRYEFERNTILAELQRLEAKAQRKFEEDKRRREQREKVQKEISKLNHDLSSRGFAEFYATDVVLNAMDLLEERGFFYDEVEREVSETFLPWLSQELAGALAVKETIVEIKKKTIVKADEIKKNAKRDLSNQNNQQKENVKQKKDDTLRKMLIEDRAGTNIRRTMKEYHEKKAKEEEERRHLEEEEKSQSNREENLSTNYDEESSEV